MMKQTNINTAERNPSISLDNSLHLQKYSSCGFYADGITLSFFFENANEKILISSNRYVNYHAI